MGSGKMGIAANPFICFSYPYFYSQMLQVIRLPNLIIVAITQYLLQYLVLTPALDEAGMKPILDPLHFALLVLTTISIAAGGYLINDIIDYKTDLINKPTRVVINKKISFRTATNIYLLFTTVGAVIASYLAHHVGNILLFFIYPFAVLLLYLYSLHLKKTSLWGNFVVSAFCAGVAGIVLFAERKTFTEIKWTHPGLANKVSVIFIGYFIFAFVATLTREIIKDIEDMEGDQKTGLRTYPIVHGMESARNLSVLISFILFVALDISAYWLFMHEEWAGFAFMIFCLIGPVCFIIVYLKKSEIKQHFSTLSKLTKWIMLAGLLLLIIIWKF